MFKYVQGEKAVSKQSSRLFEMGRKAERNKCRKAKRAREELMKKIRVILWGFGAMGSGIARMILQKKGIEITGVVDGWEELVGKDMYERLGVERGEHPEVCITNQPEAVISRQNADIVVLATDSFTAKAAPKIEFCLERGLNVVTTAEEMSWPWAQEKELALEIDRLARRHHVSVLGTGVNPGFVLDLLVLVLSGACEDVKSIEASRINDLSPFGRAVMEEQGVGLSPEDFAERNAAGKLAGHVGFPESIGIIAKGLGVEITDIRQSKDPIVSSVERKPPYAYVAPGHVAGIRQQSWAKTSDGKDFIHLDHPQQVLPGLEGVETGDYITLHCGDYDMNLRIKPETPGGIGTIAMIVNMIPHVIDAEPGLRSLLDLPIPHAILGDFSEQLKNVQEERRFYKKGDLVTVETVSLEAGKRAGSVPPDTAEKPLLVWDKGFLQEDAYTGDEVEIETLIGRRFRGRLCNRPVHYQHDFGEMQPELIRIHQQVTKIAFGEAEA